MANNQANRRKRDIKTKLMAAVSMLLVSSIMMVSSTYAWFTLSTAPEVKGITTAVGANGNLEMALLPKDGSTPGNSATGDGTLDTAQRNVTWGNLVDLSDTTVYGLDKITLFPSALNLDTATNKLGEAFLQTPAYGADGRVSELLKNTVAGYYDSATSNFIPDDDFGVRAVGTASGMTDRQLDYRNARSAGNNAAAYAKTLASQSLNTNGSALADIAIAHGLAKDGNESYTQADVTALKAIVNDLQTKILPQIENAYMQYILAYAASGASDDAKWTAVKGAVTAETATLNSVITALGGGNAMPSALSTAIEKYNTTKGNVDAASNELSTLSTAEDATFAWNDISSPMQKLAKTENMKVNDLTISEVKADPDKLVDSFLDRGGLELAMASGAGVYADIADQCGDFTASIKITKVEYGGMSLKDVTARMATKTALSIVYLDAISAAVTAAQAPAGGTTGSMPITDMYGYIIDLAFRTNAAESDLLLQVEAEDRIYSDNTNDETMGGGSSMTFKATTTDFTDAQVKELMKAIRIVFFYPDSKEVIIYAKLSPDANLTADGWQADMYLYSKAADGTEIREEDNVIMPLTQNTAAKLSMLVYLDGELVGNDDVAATAASSMTGKMNIQFASSANLVPMEYAALHQGTGSGTGTGTTTTTTYDVTVPTGVTGENKATANTAYTFTVADGYTLGTVTVGGTDITTDVTESSGTYTIPADKVTGAIVINATAAAG